MDDLIEKLKSKSALIIVGGTVLVLLVLKGGFLNGTMVEKENTIEDELAILEEQEETIGKEVEIEEEKTTETESSVSDHLIYVDIKGAVKQPNMYEMLAHQRVQHLIDKAGGLTEHADQQQINLAQVLEDQMVIYIPTVGEEVKDELKMNFNSAASQNSKQERSADEKININSADLSQLTQLNGIGEKKAQAIISYREENGPFARIEDITQVSGIADKSFEQLKDQITVG